jgi:hypothetical protein
MLTAATGVYVEINLTAEDWFFIRTSVTTGYRFYQYAGLTDLYPYDLWNTSYRPISRKSRSLPTPGRAGFNDQAKLPISGLSLRV